MNKFTVTFKVSTESQLQEIEFYLKDLLNSSVLPAINAELIPLTYEVKKAR